ncbi:hypothetical protein SLEP1_g18688 [Rubroshorea leprosula]|uniref:DUF4283 domain-containing protein n=1 Tax=Rubroshorea leprosula TaxID=152421 RepID=A0AAV5J483_9ROSI|nr:hypothetical protein SLEP1_g18688 [Rubroshorea leprosula]
MERVSTRVKARFPTARDSSGGLKQRLPGYGSQFMGQATTYFFYDFPEDRFPKDMWFTFWSFRKVADVYIPTCRDRRGRRFGFVRMVGISDVKDMEGKLNQIWLDSYQLKAKGKNGKEISDFKCVRDGTDSVCVKQDIPLKVGNGEPELVLEFSPTEGETTWLKKAWWQWFIIYYASKNRLVWLRFTGVPLKVWSERCFTELGGLIGEVILVDEDTRKSDTEYFDNGYDEAEVNADGFLGDDGENEAEDCAVTSVNSKWLLKWHANSKEANSMELLEDNGPAKHGPIQGELDGPTVERVLDRPNVEGLDDVQAKHGSVVGVLDGPNNESLEEMQAETGYVKSSDGQNRELIQRRKKSKNLEMLYAGAQQAERPREMGTRNITARSRFRKERKVHEQQTEIPADEQCASVSDGCIHNRNNVIFWQLELEEVRRLFQMGQRLGIQCQQNEDEVMSRLVALEERDEANFRGA